MISDVTRKDYVNIKRGAEDRSTWHKLERPTQEDNNIRQ